MAVGDRMRVAGKHSCDHLARQHRHGGWGRCTAPRCLCTSGPGPVPRPSVLEPPARATVKTTADGLVTEFMAPERPQPSLRRKLESMLWRRLEVAGVRLPDAYEYRFAASIGRQFRSDGFYKPDLLVEVDGGTWSPNPGRHNQPAGYDKDCEKLNCAAILGYRVLRFTAPMVRSGLAVETIRQALTPVERVEQIAL